MESIDHTFDNVRFGEFDRHALFWHPPFFREVATNRALVLPVQFDGPRFMRECVAGAIVVFALFTVAHLKPRQRRSPPSPTRPLFGLMAPLVALLLPIPPVGLLAFSSWESLTDSNHGIPFIWFTLVYWAVLSILAYVAMQLSWFLWQEWTTTRRAS